MQVETILKAVKKVRGEDQVTHFKMKGSGQETIENARKAFPGHRLILRGWTVTEKDGTEKNIPVNLTSEYTLKGKV